MKKGDEFAPHLLVSSQSEGVGQQGSGVQVIELASRCSLQTGQAVVYHGILSHGRYEHTYGTDCRKCSE